MSTHFSLYKLIYLMEAFNDEFASRANVLVRVSVHKALTFTTAASAGRTLDMNEDIKCAVARRRFERSYVIALGIFRSLQNVETYFNRLLPQTDR